MESIWRVVRHGVRSLWKTPAFTWTVVLLLGLGVGSVTTIFTLVDHILLRPLPYPAADRLVSIQNGSHAVPDFEDFQQFQSVDGWAAATVGPANLTGVDRPHRLQVAQISPDFFPLFAARPFIGRLLVPEEFRTGEGVVLSYGTWQGLFGGDADVVGRSITIDGMPVEVVGVLEATFVPPEALVVDRRVGGAVDVWRPIDPTAGWVSSRSSRMLSVAGRVRPGGSIAAVQAEAEALAERRAQELPDVYAWEGVKRTLPVVTLQEATVGSVGSGLGLLFGAVTILLLVACTNVAHLFMARGLGRVREMAIRRALGARTATLSGQLLLESLLVAAGGAALGLLLAVAGLRGFLALYPEVMPRTTAIGIDLRILAFAVTIAVMTTLVFGVLPALRLAGRDLAGTLQSGGRGNSGGRMPQRVRAGLVVAEVALSLILVIQAGALLRSFAQLHDQDPGFRTENVWTLPLTTSGIGGAEEWVRRMEGVRASLAETPGVRLATFGITMPLEFTGGARCCWSLRPVVAGVEDDRSVLIHPVDLHYFDVLGLRFIAGIPWTRDEQDADPRPAVVTEALAVQLFGSASEAIDRELRLGDVDIRIAGVVTDNLYYGSDQPAATAVYLPITALPWPGPHAHMAVLVESPYNGLSDQLREAVWRAEPDLPVPTVRPLDEWAGAAIARQRFESLLFTTFGVVALLLVAGGLYGTLLYAVRQRRREFGIRLAVGAAPAGVVTMVLGQAVRIAVAGSVIGLAGAWVSGRLLANRAFDFETGDPGTSLIAVALLMGVALAASWFPARRAAATDPMEALRAE